MIDVVALIREAAAAALNAQAEVAQRATQNLAPKDTLALSESIKISEATTLGLVSQVYSDSEYALRQHEQLNLRHDDGQAKYMEVAVIEERAAIQRAGADAARRVLS